LPDWHEEPLEVTTDADENVVATAAIMGGIDRVEYAGERIWMVSVPNRSERAGGVMAPFDRDGCLKILVPFIEAIERDGFEHFATDQFAWDPASPHRPAALDLMGRGVRFGSSAPVSNPDLGPGILFGVGGGGAYGPDGIADEIERVARDTGNQEKLRARATARRRHLFVFITGGSVAIVSPALSAVLDGRMPLPRKPELPDPITTAWVGFRDRGLYITPQGSGRPSARKSARVRAARPRARRRAARRRTPRPDWPLVLPALGCVGAEQLLSPRTTRSL
jgi:hypothetical protein